MAKRRESAMPRIGGRRALVAVGLALALAAAALAGLGHLADFGRIDRALEEANLLWCVGCAAGQLVAYVGYVVGYRAVARARGGRDFTYLTSLKVVVFGFGAHLVASAAGSMAVDFWALVRAGEEGHAAGRRVLGLNALEWMILGLAAAVSAVVVLAWRGQDAPLAMTLGWITCVGLAFTALLWVTARGRVDRLSGLPRAEEPDRLDGRPRAWARWAAVKARKGAADLVGAAALARELLVHPRRYPGAAPGFAVYWSGALLTLWSALHAFGEPLALPGLVLAFATGYIITSSPLPVGASGAAEAAMAGSLHAVGVPLAPALLAAFLYRVFTFWLPIGPALIVLPTLRRLDEELAGTGPAPT